VGGQEKACRSKKKKTTAENIIRVGSPAGGKRRSKKEAGLLNPKGIRAVARGGAPRTPRGEGELEALNIKESR